MPQVGHQLLKIADLATRTERQKTLTFEVVGVPSGRPGGWHRPYRCLQTPRSAHVPAWPSDALSTGCKEEEQLARSA